MTPASINRMNILVTGSCGFVGSAICRGLVAQLASAPAAPEIFNVSGGEESATSLAQLSHWCRGHLGPHVVGTTAETRPYDLAWVVLDHTAVTARYGWRPRRTPADIFAEIAEKARQVGGAGIV